jgi:hypothetical protein
MRYLTKGVKKDITSHRAQNKNKKREMISGATKL